MGILYEGNPALQNSFYTITQYREPLRKLEGFLSTLNPNKIFVRYKDFPDPKTYNELQKGAVRNLTVGREYIKAKLLDTAIIEAFAMISGGDCPLELFTGPKSNSREKKFDRLEDHLDWKLIKNRSYNKNEEVRKLLADGRAYRSKFDVKTSLLAAFVYDALSHEQFEDSYSAACKMFKQELSPEKFLDTLPDFLLIHIGNILGKMAWTRAEMIQDFLNTKLQRKAS